MNGPEHYREAERDIDRANGATVDDGHAAFLLARAQVHATLALAAATVQEAVCLYTGASDDLVEWSRATAPTPVSS